MATTEVKPTSPNTPSGTETKPAAKKPLPNWVPDFFRPKDERAAKWVAEQNLTPNRVHRVSSYIYTNGFFGADNVEGQRRVAERMTDTLNLLNLNRAFVEAEKPSRQTDQDMAVLNRLEGRFVKLKTSLPPEAVELIQRNLSTFRELLSEEPQQSLQQAQQAMQATTNPVKNFINFVSFGVFFPEASDKAATEAWSRVAVRQQLYRALDVMQAYEHAKADDQQEVLNELFGEVVQEGQGAKIRSGGLLASAAYTLEHPEVFRSLLTRDREFLTSAKPAQSFVELLVKDQLMRTADGQPMTLEQGRAALEISMMQKHADRLHQIVRIIPDEQALEALKAPEKAGELEGLLMRLRDVTWNLADVRQRRYTPTDDALLNMMNARDSLSTWTRGVAARDMSQAERVDALKLIRQHGRDMAQAAYVLTEERTIKATQTFNLPQLEAIVARENKQWFAEYGKVDAVEKAPLFLSQLQQSPANLLAGLEKASPTLAQELRQPAPTQAAAAKASAVEPAPAVTAPPTPVAPAPSTVDTAGTAIPPAAKVENAANPSAARGM